MNEEIQKTELEKDLDSIREHYHSMEDHRINISNLLDKYLLTFSTGTLALSASFTEKIIGQTIQGKIILGIGWGFLIVTIITTIVSIFLSTEAFEEQQKIDLKMLRAICSGKILPIQKKKFNNVISKLSLVTMASFIVGIILLSIFYFINIS